MRRGGAVLCGRTAGRRTRRGGFAVGRFGRDMDLHFGQRPRVPLGHLGRFVKRLQFGYRPVHPRGHFGGVVTRLRQFGQRP